MKKIKEILFPTLLVIYLVMITGFISSKEKVQKITALEIRIIDSTDNQFIKSAEVRNMLEQKEFNPFGKPAVTVNLRDIERALKSRQIISRAEAFITEPGVVHVEIRQKTPSIRIFNRQGQGYYLDNSGNIIPLSANFGPHVIVASGYITEPFRIGQTQNIFDVAHDSLSRSKMTIYEVYRLADFISGDDFWKAQIEQIYVNSNHDFELIPRVGPHVIELGRADDLEEKFGNLKLLYLEGLNNLGWNQYDKISLKYKNQVVCTKIQ
jgi:cell division protein FtsQ